MTQYHCRFMAQTGSDIIAGFSQKHGPMWKWVEGKRVSRAIWSFDWAWCVMDKTNVFATCLWLIHWVQCAVRKSTLSECPGDKNPYKYQQMKQPHQKGTEMGTTWNFCLTGNHTTDGCNQLWNYEKLMIGPLYLKKLIGGWSNATSRD